MVSAIYRIKWQHVKPVDSNVEILSGTSADQLTSKLSSTKSTHSNN